MSEFSHLADLTDLAAFQIAFVENMRQRLQAESSDSAISETRLHDALIPAQKLSPEQALQVYSQDYRVRLTQVLNDHFSAIHFLLGDQEFMALCNDFIYAQPSRHFDLGQFGGLLPAFIHSHSSGVERPFLEQLAELEWELNQIFHQALVPGNDLSLMQSAADPGALCFEFIPSLRLWHSPYALFDLWNLSKNADKVFEIQAPQSLISYKNQQGVRVSRLKGIQIPLFEKLLAAQSLDQAFSKLETNADSGSEIAELFALLKQEALVASLQA